MCFIEPRRHLRQETSRHNVNHAYRPALFRGYFSAFPRKTPSVRASSGSGRRRGFADSSTCFGNVGYAPSPHFLFSSSRLFYWSSFASWFTCESHRAYALIVIPLCPRVHASLVPLLSGSDGGASSVHCFRANGRALFVPRLSIRDQTNARLTKGRSSD